MEHFPKLIEINESIDFYNDFNPVASSSQQCSSLQMQSIQQVDNNKSVGMTKLSKKSITPIESCYNNSSTSSWHQYMNKTQSHNVQHHKTISLSQMKIHSSGDKWSMKTWHEAITDSENESKSYNIKWLKRYCKGNQVKNCIPFLAAMIIGVDSSSKESNATLSLMDPTGVTTAVVHKNVYTKYAKHLVQDSVIIIRNFSLLPGFRSLVNYYINITDNNLQAIYTAKEDCHATSTKISIKSFKGIEWNDEKNKEDSCESTKERSQPDYCISTIKPSKIRKENVKSCTNIVNIEESKGKIVNNLKIGIELFDDDFPDLDFDLDFDNDAGSFSFPAKKQKLDQTQLPLNSKSSSRFKLSNSENALEATNNDDICNELTSSDNTINENNVTTDNNKKANEISSTSSINMLKDKNHQSNVKISHNLSSSIIQKDTMPKKRFRFVKSDKACDKKIPAVDYNKTMVNYTCGSSATIVKSVQTPVCNEAIVKSMFEGLDTSFFDEDF